MADHPNELVISLQPPSRILLASAPLELLDKGVKIAGQSVEANDTPWPAMADLLIDRETRELVGLTFCVPFDKEEVRRLSTRLDPRVVRYNDMSTSELRRPYDESDMHWFEIFWKRTCNAQMRLAQLMNGEYWWWYSSQGEWEFSKPVVALSMSGLNAVLDHHSLTFPREIDLPTLDVRYG